MAADEIDRAEIDRLIKELATPPAPAPRPTVATPAASTPGSRWTTGQLMMPAARPQRRKMPAFVSALSLPALPRMDLPAIFRDFPALLGAPTGPRAARMFVALGVLLSAAMPYWPYSNAWSWGLLTYLCAVDLVVITGVWGAKLTWDARLPAAHTVAIGVICWGLALLAAEAVPRIGYAATYPS